MRSYPEPREVMELSTKHYTKIIKDVWALLEFRDLGQDSWMEVLDHDNPHHNYKALNDKLQSLLDSVQDYPSDTLVGYLRYSGRREQHLPAWHPLRDAAVKQCTERNSPEFTAVLFSGLLTR